MDIFKQVREIVIDYFLNHYGEIAKNFDLSKVSVEQPKDDSHGDASSNIAMIVAKSLGKNPREVAEKIKSLLIDNEWFTKVEVAGPGFINFSINQNKLFTVLNHIIEKPDFGRNNIGNNRKVNIEFVSANPTGPLHIGHLRNAVFGNALAKTLAFSGFDVTKEFYVNDAGSQIIVLAKSCYLRYREICTGQIESIPDGLYPGEYLIDIAKKIHLKYSDSLLNKPEDEMVEIFKAESIELILQVIKSNLKMLDISFDIFFSEKSLHENNQIENVIKKLDGMGLLYRGILEPPKGKIPDDWEPREQLLFKSTLFGDDVDRPLQKSDNSWTYISPDIAYLENKISRGFSQLIYVLGADHGGYEARLKAACNALSNNKIEFDVKITQLVHFVKNGTAVKMSKRSGNFLLVEDVVKEVGKDVVCFMMLTRRNDQTIDFDFEKVKETTKNNPVIYVQYAHARVMSVFRAAETPDFAEIMDCYKQKQYQLELLDNPDILNFIKKLCLFARIVELSAIHHEPHRIVFYLIDIASNFHQIWSLGKDNQNLRFLNQDQVILSASYLALLKGFKNIVTTGLKLFNVDPIDSM